MFSNLIFVLNHLKFVVHGFVPIDMKNYPTIYNEKNKIFKSYNSWDYYFEPVSKSSLKDAYRNGKIITCSSFNYKNFELCSNNIKKIYKKYIKIKKIYSTEAYKFVNKFIKLNKVLAVHYRGTSYKTFCWASIPSNF